ncbi:endonuclease/exonuclease/phosphatase family protein [Helcococcus bovis]|uniref:endonuclease/exonuclease/phosphatase family protein n=1 Tax=Helcococcus bovis TaxID=3153252 RepID=UPI0038BD761F
MKKELQLRRKFAVILLIFSFLVQTAVPIVIYAKEDNSVIYSVEKFKTDVRDGETVKVKGYIGEPWKKTRSKTRKVTNFELSDNLENLHKTGIPVEYDSTFEKKYSNSYENNKGKLVIIEGTKKGYFNTSGLKSIKSITPVETVDENLDNTSHVDKEKIKESTDNVKKENEEVLDDKNIKEEKNLQDENISKDKENIQDIDNLDNSIKSKKTSKEKSKNKKKTESKFKDTSKTKKETLQDKIKNLKVISISDALKEDLGYRITTKGYVISRPGAFGYHSFAIRDENNKAIFVQSYLNLNVKYGDYIYITGYINKNNDVIQLENIEQVFVDKNTTSENKFVSNELKINEINNDYISNLINVKDAVVLDSRDLGFAFLINIKQDENQAAILINKNSNISFNNISDGSKINVTGILSKFNNTYQIMPFEDEHLMIDGKEVYNYVKVGDIQGEGLTSPFEGKKVKVQNVVVTAIHNQNNFYVQDIEDDKNEKTSDGILINVKSKDKEIKPGKVLELEGYVSEEFGDGYQEKKYTDLTITKINVTDFKIKKIESKLPEPIIITQDLLNSISEKTKNKKSYEDYINFWESKESMLVNIKDAKTLGPMNKGEIFVSLDKTATRYNKMHGINLTEYGNPDIIGLYVKSNSVDKKDNYGNIKVNSGDYISDYTGPLTYAYGAYKIYVPLDNRDKLSNVIKNNNLNREVTHIESKNDLLTIASYNIQNFAPKSGNTSHDKVEKIANSIKDNLKNPDIISLVEMQDDSGKSDDAVVSAKENAEELIKEIKKVSNIVYEYKDLEPSNNMDGGEKGSNIRVGFLYNPNRVTFDNIEKIGESNFEFEDVRKSLAANFTFNGKKVLVIANHLNSKRGDEPQFGKNQPPVNGSEPKREKLAQIIYKYVVDKKIIDPKLNVVLTGDFNDFEFSNTLKILEGSILTNLVKNYDVSDRFSYFHNGNSQTLDHILVSNKLVNDAKFDMVHINSMFMEESGRASDHDPVIVQLKLNDNVENVNEYNIPKDSDEITPIKKLFSSELDKIYKIEGTVISKSGIFGKNGFYIQDDEGYGIYVNNEYRINLLPGYKVILKGTLDNYFGLLELKNVNIFDKIKSEKINPKVVNIENIPEENPYTLVKLENLLVRYIEESNSYGSSRFLAFDENNNSIKINYDNRVGEKYSELIKRLKEGYKVNITGVLSYKNGIAELLPVDKENIQIISNNVKLNDYYKIGQVQGLSHKSNLEQRYVKLKDVVVTFIDSENSFYIQDINPDGNDKTSDGIYVNYRNHKLNVGDKIELEGRVREIFGDGYGSKYKSDLSITQINALKTTKISENNDFNIYEIDKDSIPSKYIDNDRFMKFDPKEDSIDFWESKEGMIVKLNQAKVVGPQLSKQIYLLPHNTDETLNKLGGYNLNERNNPNIIGVLTDKEIKVKAGDEISNYITGPVTYNFGDYKIYVPSQEIKIKEGIKVYDKTDIVKEDNSLNIATYNVENFTALDNGDGSTSEDKVQKIANSIINDLNAPDIITLLEVQDDDGPKNEGNVSAKKSGKRLTDAISKIKNDLKYEYVDVDPENNKDGGQPGGNIRIGLIYNPDRVQFENVESIGKNNPLFNGVRKSLVANFIFKNEKIMVVANHLNSKIGDDALFGSKQPPLFKTEIKRVKLAQVINNYISEKLKDNPELKVVVTGDFNDYENSKTLKTIAGDDLINLVDSHPNDDRFSFFFRGVSQTLDHILVSKNIKNNIKFDMIHINSLFMEEHGRASDHDPVMVKILFMNKSTEEINKTNTDNSNHENDKVDMSNKNQSTKVEDNNLEDVLKNKNVDSSSNDSSIEENLDISEKNVSVIENMDTSEKNVSVIENKDNRDNNAYIIKNQDLIKDENLSKKTENLDNSEKKYKKDDKLSEKDDVKSNEKFDLKGKNNNKVENINKTNILLYALIPTLIISVLIISLIIKKELNKNN